MTQAPVRILALIGLLALPSAVALADDCPTPRGSLVRIPKPGDGNLVVCGGRYFGGFDTDKDGPHCVYSCDGTVTATMLQNRPHPAAEGTDFLDARGLWIVPGFVDLRSSVGVRGPSNEESSEVTPSLDALDFVDPADPDFRRALEAGVTSVGVAPGGRAVIGGTMVVLKTDGRPLSQRVLANRVALSATLGYEPTMGNRSARFARPNNFYFRRPNNRMGLAAELERSFFAAKYDQLGEGLDAKIMEAAMEGLLPVTFRARKDQDIRTALRLSEDFGLRPVIVEGTEAWRQAETLAAREVPVLLGPLYQGPRRGFEFWEGDDPRSAVGRLLDEAGVKVGFASGPDDPPGSLREWALLSVRHGMTARRALLGMTSYPAEMLGLESRIGRISWGTDADLVVMDGHPLDPTSRVLVTIVNGRVAWAHEDAPPLTTVSNPTASLIPTGDPR